MPVLASCMLLGGVGPAHVVMAGLNLFAIATLCASVGFLFSVLCLRTQDALMASYAVLAAYAVIPPLAHDFVFKLGVNRRVAGWFNPPVAFSIFVGQVEGGESVGPGTLAGWADGLRCLPLCALVSLACFLAAIRLFPAFADGEPTHVWKRVSQRLDRLFDLLNRGLWWVDFRSDPLEGNPVAWKERHFRFLGKTSHLIWAGCLMGIGLCLLYAIPLANQPGIWWERDFHATVLTVMAVLLYVAVTIFASSSIAAEKDRGTWDVLLSSTLYGRHILWGKISGTVRASLLFCVLPVLHLLLSVLFTWIGGPRQGAIGFWVAFAVVVVLFGGALLQLSVGTYFSIRSSSALNAFLWTLGLGLAVNLVVPSVLALLFDDVGPLCMSPTMGPSLVVYGHAFGTLFFSLIYIIVSCALLARMEERFDQLVGRSPSIPLTGALRFRFRRFLPGDKPD
jgi:ABC-type transport system involved in multi-copper enzyme maturation permease subunit